MRLASILPGFRLSGLDQDDALVRAVRDNSGGDFMNIEMSSGGTIRSGLFNIRVSAAGQGMTQSRETRLSGAFLNNVIASETLLKLPDSRETS